MTVSTASARRVIPRTSSPSTGLRGTFSRTSVHCAPSCDSYGLTGTAGGD